MKLEPKAIPPVLRNVLPFPLMRRLRAVPFAYEPGTGRGTLVVAMAEPGDLAAQDDIAFAAGMRVRAVPASGEALDGILDLPLEGSAQRVRADQAGASSGLELRPDADRTTDYDWFIPGPETRY